MRWTTDHAGTPAHSRRVEAPSPPRRIEASSHGATKRQPAFSLFASQWPHLWRQLGDPSFEPQGACLRSAAAPPSVRKRPVGPRARVRVFRRRPELALRSSPPRNRSWPANAPFECGAGATSFEAPRHPCSTRRQCRGNPRGVFGPSPSDRARLDEAERTVAKPRGDPAPFFRPASGPPPRARGLRGSRMRTPQGRRRRAPPALHYPPPRPRAERCGRRQPPRLISPLSLFPAD